jgi:hypothetical protein
MDQAAENVDAFDAADEGQHRHRLHGPRDRQVEADAPVRAAGVVVLEILGQDPLQVVPVPDQYPVQALGP